MLKISWECRCDNRFIKSAALVYHNEIVVNGVESGPSNRMNRFICVFKQTKKDEKNTTSCLKIWNENKQNTSTYYRAYRETCVNARLFEQWTIKCSHSILLRPRWISYNHIDSTCGAEGTRVVKMWKTTWRSEGEETHKTVVDIMSTAVLYNILWIVRKQVQCFTRQLAVHDSLETIQRRRPMILLRKLFVFSKLFYFWVKHLLFFKFFFQL